jgi:integrase
LEALSKPELLALLGAARAHSERNWLMILTAFSHGLRASEVVALQTDAIADGHITVRRLKGSLATTQPLLSDLNPLLDERAGLFAFMRNLHGNQKLFPVCRQHFWRLVQRYASEARHPGAQAPPARFETHDRRCKLLGTAGIENVRQYLGHKSNGIDRRRI